MNEQHSNAARVAVVTGGAGGIGANVVQLLSDEGMTVVIADLDAETVDYEDVNALVDARYGPPEDTDGVLYDQLCNEETAYKFYDDLIEAIEASDAEFAIKRNQLLATLSAIREEEREGAQQVTELMERRE